MRRDDPPPSRDPARANTPHNQNYQGCVHTLIWHEGASIAAKKKTSQQTTDIDHTLQSKKNCDMTHLLMDHVQVTQGPASRRASRTWSSALHEAQHLLPVLLVFHTSLKLCQYATCGWLLDTIGITSTDCYSPTVQRCRYRYRTKLGKPCQPKQPTTSYQHN